MNFQKKAVGNSLKFVTHNLNLIKKDLQYGNLLTPEQVERLNEVKTSLEQERELLKIQDREERIGAHVRQAVRLVNEFKDTTIRKNLFRNQYPIIGVSQITSSTPGVSRSKKKRNTKNEPFA